MDTPLRKQFAADVTVKAGDRAVVAKITTEAVDRDGEVLLASGMDSTDFEKSPTVFFNHDYTVPVARCVGMKREDDHILAKTTFPEAPDDHQGEWLPNTLLHMFAEHIINGFSVGFAPIESRPPSKKDREQFGDDVRFVFSKWKLLEYSVAPLPANQDALRTAVGKRLITKSAALMVMPGIEIAEPSPKRIIVVPVALPIKAADFAREPGENMRECMARGIDQLTGDGIAEEAAIVQAYKTCLVLAPPAKAIPKVIRKRRKLDQKAIAEQAIAMFHAKKQGKIYL